MRNFLIAVSMIVAMSGATTVARASGASVPVSGRNTVEINLVNIDSQGNAAVSISIPGRGLAWAIPNSSHLRCNIVSSSRASFVGDGTQSNAGLVGMGRTLVQQNLKDLSQQDTDEIANSFAAAAAPVILAAERECGRKGLLTR